MRRASAAPPEPAGAPRTRRLLWWLGAGLLLAALLGVAVLTCVIAHDNPADFVYPGAVAGAAGSAAALGLYGAYETPDSADAVAAWYAARGRPASRSTLGGLPSVAGSRGRVARVPVPGSGRRSVSAARSITWPSAMAHGP